MSEFVTVELLEQAGVVIGERIKNLLNQNSFLPPSDLFDESSTLFFYFGWENVNGGWLVQRQNRSTSITESATTGHTNLTEAFADRINLEYS